MNPQQILDHSFTTFYTNSIINAQHNFSALNKLNFSNSQSSSFKFLWRRLYDDMINLSINNENQYFCSPLDWNAFIQVEIQKNGVFIGKRIYGPILLQQRLKKKTQQNKKYIFQTYISINQNKAKYSKINLFTQQSILFQIAYGQVKLQVDREFMKRRGWDTLHCSPDSQILIIQAKNLKNQWSSFLEKIKINNLQKQENYSKDTLKIAFNDRIQREQFLINLFKELSLQKQHSKKYFSNLIVNRDEKKQQSKKYLQSKNGLQYKKQQVEESIGEILDNDAVGNTTMQDLYNLIYTPSQSIINFSQESYQYKKSEVLNITQQHNYHNLYKNFNENSQTQSKLNKLSKQQQEKKQIKKCSISINFNNSEVDIQCQNQIIFEYYYDPEIENFLKNPHKIKDFLQQTKQLTQQNKQLKAQIYQLKKQKELNQKKQMIEVKSNNNFKVLKNMIQQINSQMTNRMSSLQQKVSKQRQRPSTYQVRTLKQTVNNNYNNQTRKNFNHIIEGTSNFIKNIKDNRKNNQTSQTNQFVTQKDTNFLYDKNKFFKNLYLEPRLFHSHKCLNSPQFVISQQIANKNRQKKFKFLDNDNSNNEIHLKSNDLLSRRYLYNKITHKKLNNSKNVQLSIRKYQSKTPSAQKRQLRFN